MKKKRRSLAKEQFNVQIVIDNAACILTASPLDSSPKELSRYFLGLIIIMLFNPLFRSDFSGVNGILILYSVKNRESFDAVRRFFDRICAILGSSIPMVIVGNEVFLNWFR